MTIDLHGVGTADTTGFCTRRNGVAQRQGWTSEVALRELPKRVGAAERTVVEVCVGQDFRSVEPGQFSRVF